MNTLEFVGGPIVLGNVEELLIESYLRGIVEDKKITSKKTQEDRTRVGEKSKLISIRG